MINPPQVIIDGVEILFEDHPKITKPLVLIGERAYVVAWLPVKYHVMTISSGKSKRNHRHEEFAVWPLVVRDDGKVFLPEGKVYGDDSDKEKLGIEVKLNDGPFANKTWSGEGVEIYRGGIRPDPLDTFLTVVRVIDRFIDFDRSLADQKTMSEMVACYIMSTWFLDAFNVTGYLYPTGDRGTGKSNLLLVISEMAYLGQFILMGGSYPALRDLADQGATLCFDDVENLSDNKTDPDKRNLLLAGNRRGATITVKVPRSYRGWDTRNVNAFCPRCFSATSLPDPILASRSIVLPLIRTTDKGRGSADPSDFSLWPCKRGDLVDDLWAMALANLPKMPRYEQGVSERARLTGRPLQPWKSILAVALWLTEKGVEGLWDRMEALSCNYQKGKSDLETTDLTGLVIRALCQCATRAIKANPIARPAEKTQLVVSVEDVLWRCKQLAEDGLMDPDYLNNQRIGRILNQLRIEEAPRPGGVGSRLRKFSLGDLQRMCESYHLPPPDFNGQTIPETDGTPGTTGLAGTLGTTGTNGSNGTDAKDSPRIQPLSRA